MTAAERRKRSLKTRIVHENKRRQNKKSREIKTSEPPERAISGKCASDNEKAVNEMDFN